MSQKGFAHILLLLLLLAGLAVGVYLVQQKTNLFPKASVSQPTGPETSFTLVGSNDCAIGLICALGFKSDPQPGEEFEVKLYVRSDIDEANLFQAKIKFPVNLIEVIKINVEGSFINNWVENFYDNLTGEISLAGGVPAPGFQTRLGEESALMATIVFKAKTGGTGTVLFNDDSQILRNTDNENILKIKRDYDISIGTKPSPTPTPAPESYSRVFITSTAYNGNLGGLSGADSKCQARADAANLGGTWKAWLSDDVSSSATRLNHSSVPYKTLDGKVVADNWDDLTDGSLQNAISVTENNTFFKSESCVWTQTKVSGALIESKSQNLTGCNGFTVADKNISYCGVDGSKDSNWTQGSLESCNIEHPIYCFEQTAVSAPPTPTPTPTSTPTSPPGQKGDGNKDNKINLIDMSVLLTDFNKEQGYREPIDMNDDKKINTFDFSLHRKLLLELGVIK
ncbi:hypothetical protein A3B42_02920 [Candidatus Daviesbacteria bacterium RIFCSPLOWO2_01_FULL_38_10]|uniref:Collagenase NC10/endostatin domain-containing protein n=1 Tax=Candidatus Daviesbacteria bacterium GW2011_GWF2_38_6 TaxID=1618432 RepID=A0A0G0KQZ9_9BACT|nr:MAG: hypothetical protein US99_C0032G0006 [Candidatus Daviesbacteria bacterium GW2011_GWF2_38_6]OGE27979.1 MAG: hypothetical protein A3D02_04075 [Candidatus Daviesbacteria bacterium RIFCSPHIGHO2_02_FULL_39_41]OGE38656.1 MAG: hypothetical protein A3B42_02920 [Candidatus Daviesbacteria bacterium RIFCSPLOWO2_01_FULL_38_10]OGE68520.1 MAG: hypothetical protein A3H81_02195 [Candidatus Daviesbacteria bacterium RIFCSPLOWO2_02_FULL_38_18]OGE72499.1 MAG: hypothetical protein A3H18_03055 [Candidatus Da